MKNKGWGKLSDIRDGLIKLYSSAQMFSTEDAISLACIVTSIEAEHPMVVEIGSWKGLSTAVLANQVKAYDGKLFAIDHWMGTPNTITGAWAALEDVYSLFRLNMKYLDLWDTINPLVMDSETAASIFKDDVLDLVFIDADHCYKANRQDIEMWLPKLKDGGILCGHDAEFYYSKLSDIEKRVVDESLEEDYILLGYTEDTGIHPGVVRALYDCLEDKQTLMPLRIWHYTKGG